MHWQKFQLHNEVVRTGRRRNVERCESNNEVPRRSLSDKSLGTQQSSWIWIRNGRWWEKDVSRPNHWRTQGAVEDEKTQEADKERWRRDEHVQPNSLKLEEEDKKEKSQLSSGSKVEETSQSCDEEEG